MDGQIRKRPIGEPLAETIQRWRAENPQAMLSFEKLDELRTDWARATLGWSGGTFKHFATPEDEARHLEQVKQAQKEGAPF